jgi:hypothetical protein
MHADPGDPSLSRDGTRVAFDQFNRQFGFGMTGSGQVFVRDLGAATTTLASGGAGADIVELPSLSADGNRVSFTTNFDQDFRCSARATAPTSATYSLRGLGAGCAVGFRDGGTGGAAGGAGGGGSAGSGGPKPDETPPRITSARLTHARFAVAAARTALLAASRPNLRGPRAPRGTSFLFSLSERATITIAMTHAAAGRRSGGRCVKPRPGLQRRCMRTVAVLTLSRRSGPRGANSIPFSGRAGRTTLEPGRYVAQIVARDPAGNRSKPAALTFTVVRH